MLGLAIGSKKGSSSVACRPRREKMRRTVKNAMSPRMRTTAKRFTCAFGSLRFCFPPDTDLHKEATACKQQVFSCWGFFTRSFSGSSQWQLSCAHSQKQVPVKQPLKGKENAALSVFSVYLKNVVSHMFFGNLAGIFDETAWAVQEQSFSGNCKATKLL